MPASARSSLSLLTTDVRSKLARVPLDVSCARWVLEKSGVWGAAGHPSSSRWRAETAQALSFVAAMVRVMPWRKGSVFDAGSVR